MSARSTPVAAPTSRGPSRPRLGSVKPPPPRTSLSRPLQDPPAKSVQPQCTNADCGTGDVAEDDGKLICRSCGFVVREVHIAQEVTFGEAANGAAIVQGVYVGANETGARSSALVGSKLGGGLDSRQVTERNGLQQINNIVSALHLTSIHRDRAMNIYRLAMNVNFIQGRSTRDVAAVCLYIACRRDTDSKMMLIDFSDILEVNVFRLGQVYNTLVQEIGLRTDGVGIYDINPENLVQRFAQDLEFGADEHRIANEAVQILKRMKRDWMLVGRRPAGVCGAALILAARMNNYRRTVREVVYTAKVADITIHKRLEEFKFTESSRLSVAEFRHHGLSLEKEQDPPAFYEQFLTKKKRRKKNTGTALDEVSDDGSPHPEDAERSIASPDARRSTSTGTSERDRQAMPPPPIPIDPALLEGSEDNSPGDGAPAAAVEDGPDESATTGQKRKRGRPLGAKAKPLPEKTTRAIEDEKQIESDMDAILNDPQEVAQASEVHQAYVPPEPETHPELEATTPPPTLQPETRRSATPEPVEPVEPFSGSGQVHEDNQPDQDQDTPRPSTEKRPASHIPDTPIIPPEEFAGDPEVDDCLLSPAEVAIKEKMWVHENADFLRTQQAKRIKREMADAARRAAGIDGETGKRGSKRKKRPHARMGDLTAYGISREGSADGSSGRGGFKDAAQATKAMLERRGFSRKINYQRVEHLYGTGHNKKKKKSTSWSAGASQSPTGASEGDASSPTASSPSRVPSLFGANNPRKAAVEETHVLPTPQATANEAATSQATADEVVAPRVEPQPAAAQGTGLHEHPAAADEGSDPDDYIDDDEGALERSSRLQDEQADEDEDYEGPRHDEEYYEGLPHGEGDERGGGEQYVDSYD